MKRPLPAHLALPSLLLACALAAPAAAGELSWFFGPAGGVGDVVAFDETTGAPLAQDPALAGIQLLPLDFVGRIAHDDLMRDAARLFSDVPGAARIQLPEGAGSLYHFRRDGAGGANFGYLFVDAEGAASSVFELPGTGAGLTDPFVDKVGLASDGSSVLVATTLAAGGEVYEVDLASATATERTAGAGPLAVQANGLALLATWGVVVADDAVYRFERQPGAGLVAVPISPVPAFVGDGVATSEDGSTAAAVAGDLATQAHVYLFGPTGAPDRVTDAPTTLAGPGFLPEEPDGPYLALAPDGSACLWRTQVLTGEAWTKERPLPTPAIQLTEDANFEDTLDSTGEFGFFDPTNAFLLVGEEDNAGIGTDNADLYRIQIDPVGGGTTITNLSRTSGVTQAPFVAGTLKSEGAIYRIPDLAGLLVHEDLSSNQGNLGVVRAGAPGFQVLRSGVGTVMAVDRAGERIAMIADSSAGVSELLSIPPTLAAVELEVGLASGQVFERLVGRGDGWVALLVRVTGGDWVARYDLSTGQAQLLTEVPLPIGSVLAFTPSGAMAFSVDFTPQRSIGVTWNDAGQVALFPTSGRFGFYLPGS